MELTDAINGRRAVRDYTLAAVGERQIRDLIDAAVRAPSAIPVAPLFDSHILELQSGSVFDASEGFEA